MRVHGFCLSMGVLFCLFASPLFAEDNLCAIEGLDRCETHSQPVEACQKVIAGGFPRNAANEMRICHRNYLVSANKIAKTPNWVAYHLYADQIAVPGHRVEYFCPDPCLKTNERAELSDYKGLFPVYNRGHLNPAGDNHWDNTAYKESYFLSNMVPQNPDNNGGIWLDLEKRVDSWTKEYGELYVITGPIYDYEGVKHKEVGGNKVWAPAGLFKIIYEPRKKQVLSFMMPNTSLNAKTLSTYLTSIDNINKATGLDLFPNLPKALKAKKPTAMWPANV